MRMATVVALIVLALALVGCAAKKADIVGPTWEWQEFQDTADVNNITVSDPHKYTLTLQPDGTASILADCNQVSWTYTLEGSSLKFETLGPSTMAYCGDDSLDQEYLKRLGATATYVLADGKLHLNLMYDSGNVVFAPAK